MVVYEDYNTENARKCHLVYTTNVRFRWIIEYRIAIIIIYDFTTLFSFYIFDKWLVSFCLYYSKGSQWPKMSIRHWKMRSGRLEMGIYVIAHATGLFVRFSVGQTEQYTVRAPSHVTWSTTAHVTSLDSGHVRDEYNTESGPFRVGMFFLFFFSVVGQQWTHACAALR